MGRDRLYVIICEECYSVWAFICTGLIDQFLLFLFIYFYWYYLDAIFSHKFIVFFSQHRIMWVHCSCFIHPVRQDASRTRPVSYKHSSCSRKMKNIFRQEKRKKGGQRPSPLCLATAPHNLGNETKPELMFALQQHSLTATLTFKIKH